MVLLHRSDADEKKEQPCRFDGRLQEIDEDLQARQRDCDGGCGRSGDIWLQQDEVRGLHE
jgi:hypothetical protein